MPCLLFEMTFLFFHKDHYQTFVHYYYYTLFFVTIFLSLFFSGKKQVISDLKTRDT